MWTVASTARASSAALRTASVAVSDPSVPTTIASYIASGRLPHPRVLGEECADLLRNTFRVVLHQEMPGVVEHDEPRARYLLLEPVGAGHGRELVSPTPQQQHGNVQPRQLATIGLELRELARAVEVELAAAAIVVGVRLPVL